MTMTMMMMMMMMMMVMTMMTMMKMIKQINPKSDKNQPEIYKNRARGPGPWDPTILQIFGVIFG